MRKILPLLLLGIFLAGSQACRTSQKAKSFPSREAFSDQYIDSQLVELRRELPGAQVERARGGIKVTFASGILFPVNAASLSPEAQLHIAKLAEILNRFPETRILVEGHTDITGTTEYNKVLSEKRAASLKEYAVTLGVDPARVGTAGHGEARPVATNSTEKGREKNRRVEVFILVTD